MNYDRYLGESVVFRSHSHIIYPLFGMYLLIFCLCVNYNMNVDVMNMTYCYELNISIYFTIEYELF